MQHAAAKAFLPAAFDSPCSRPRLTGGMSTPPAAPPPLAPPTSVVEFLTTASVTLIGLILIAVLVPLNICVAYFLWRRRHAAPTTAQRKLPYQFGISISPKSAPVPPTSDEQRRLTHEDDEGDGAPTGSVFSSFSPQATIPVSSRDGLGSGTAARTVSAVVQDMPIESVDASVAATGALRKIILPCSNESCTGRLRFNLEHFQGGKILLATCPKCEHECEYGLPSADERALTTDGSRDVDDDERVEYFEELYLTRKLQSRLTSPISNTHSPGRPASASSALSPTSPGGSTQSVRQRIERVRLARMRSEGACEGAIGADEPDEAWRHDDDVLATGMGAGAVTGGGAGARPEPPSPTTSTNAASTPRGSEWQDSPEYTPRSPLASQAMLQRAREDLDPGMGV